LTRIVSFGCISSNTAVLPVLAAGRPKGLLYTPLLELFEQNWRFSKSDKTALFWCISGG